MPAISTLGRFGAQEEVLPDIFYAGILEGCGAVAVVGGSQKGQIDVGG